MNTFAVLSFILFASCMPSVASAGKAKGDPIIYNGAYYFMNCWPGPQQGSWLGYRDADYTMRVGYGFGDAMPVAIESYAGGPNPTYQPIGMYNANTTSANNNCVGYRNNGGWMYTNYACEPNLWMPFNTTVGSDGYVRLYSAWNGPLEGTWVGYQDSSSAVRVGYSLNLAVPWSVCSVATPEDCSC